MQRADLSFQQIYNTLLAGNKLALHFLHAVAAETFRTRLHHHKSAQEKTFLSLGLAVEDERTVLSYKVVSKEGSEEVVVYVAFTTPSPLKKYPVMILEEKDMSGGAAQVSAGLE